MKKFHLLILLFAGLLILQGCDIFSSGSDDEISTSEERLFVWNGLNYWYYWQDQVPELADERKNDIPSFNRLLNTPVNEEALFNQLILEEDENSWFIEDYEEHEAARLGTSKSFGFRFGLAREYGVTGLETGNVFGYVQYIVPDSPADAAGLKRGDIFRGINGQNITLSNFLQLLDNEVYDLKMASVRRNDFGYQIDELDKTVLVQSEIINENPIHTFEMYNFGSSTVGYLFYNSFRFNYHKELNDLFGVFKRNGVNELVLDLRYNGGGSLLTSAILASMISGESENSIFAELRYNDKRSSNNEPFKFFEKVPIFDESGEFLNSDTILNSLGLSRVYILASNRTASASETMING
ncbi:MAG: S41 family peptidase, partial [Candidatus Paceibacterota bacterium]